MKFDEVKQKEYFDSLRESKNNILSQIMAEDSEGAKSILREKYDAIAEKITELKVSRGAFPDEIVSSTGLESIFVEGNSVSDTIEGLTKVFGEDSFAENSQIFTREDGVKVIKNIYGHKGLDLFLTKGKLY